VRWFLLGLLLLVLPAGAQTAKKEWVQKPRLGWVHQLGVTLAVPGKRKVTCDADGALHVETDDYLVQIFVYGEEASAQQSLQAIATESEKVFPGLKFGEVQQYAQPDGRKAFIQEGTVNGLGLLLSRISKGKHHVVVYSIMKSKDAQDATLALMTDLKFP